MKTLETRKQELMAETGIDNDTYNDLAEIALGMAEQETKFGKSARYLGKTYGGASSIAAIGVLGALAQGAHRDGVRSLKPSWQKIRKAGSFVKQNRVGAGLGALAGALLYTLWPDWHVDAAKWLCGKKTFDSKGLTRIKVKGITDDQLQALFKKYNITERTIENPEKSAIATMLLLGHMNKNELSNLKQQIKELNLENQDALMYLWQGKRKAITEGTATPERNIYIQKIKKYADHFNLQQSGDVMTSETPTA